MKEKIGKETDFPLFLYHQGKNDRIYETYGAHHTTLGGKEGYLFRVWAPHAKRVCVVGDFNGWNPEADVMERMVDGESFELFIPGLKPYDVYKYCITAADGRQLMKRPPKTQASCTISKDTNGGTGSTFKNSIKPMSFPRR